MRPFHRDAGVFDRDIGNPTRHVPLGWLMFYHGVDTLPEASPGGRRLRYSAGVMLLSSTLPTHILYRSSEPLLSPEGALEVMGTAQNVVFPTDVDRRDDPATPNRFDVYYGMADSRIGAARFDLPEGATL